MAAPRMLEGVRVLDFTQYVAGPACTQLLAEMGADVIKIELAPGGDRTRQAGITPSMPPHDKGSHSSYYLQHNHSKRSVAIDMKAAGARDLVLGLVDKVDVVVENFAPGVMARMGLGYDTLRGRNEQLIMCSISLAGQSGPLAHLPGYDFIGQAYAGVTDLLGDPSGPPIMAGVTIGDVSTGVAAAMAIGFALFHRDRTGEGQYLDASLVDTYFHMHESSLPAISLRGDDFRPTRQGSVHADLATAGIYRCGEGYLFLNAMPHQWDMLVRAMKQPELRDDPRFASLEARKMNRSALLGVLQAWFSTFATRDAALAALEGQRIPAAPVLSVNEAMQHPHLMARGTVRWIEDPILGRVAVPGMPVKFSAWPQRSDVTASRLGEDNEAVLSGIAGLDPAAISQLYAASVLVRDPTLASAASDDEL